MSVPAGFEVLALGPHLHYVGRDGLGRSVVGPVRHRRSGETTRDLSEKRDKAVAQEGQDAQTVRLTVPTMPTVAKLLADLPGMPQQPKPPKKTRWQRLKERASALRENLYDPEWHYAVRHTGADVLLWSFVIFAGIVLGKGLWWVLSL